MPERDTVAAAARSLLVSVRVPFWVPALAGANDTSTVQLAPAASDDAHLLLPSLNPAETARLRLSSWTAALEFAIVTVTGSLVDPTPVMGKFTWAGVICTAPVRPPVPLRATVAGVLTLGD